MYTTVRTPIKKCVYFLFGISVCLLVLKLAPTEYAANALSSKLKYGKLVVVGALSKNLEIGHFMLLICRGRQRNVPRIITDVHRPCSTY